MKKRAERRDLHHFFPQTILAELWFKRHGELRDDLFFQKITETTFFHDVFLFFTGIYDFFVKCIKGEI